MNICLYGAASSALPRAYLDAGEEFGRELARRGHTLVFGGGADGLMGAAARGAAAGGAKLIGVAPAFFNADGALYPGCTTLYRTETMRERKQKMEELSDAFVMAPGGIGTLEEFFEILTLRQLGRHHKPIAVLNCAGYFDGLEAFLNRAGDEGFLRAGCRTLYSVLNSPAEVLDALEKSVVLPAGIR